MKTIDVKKYFSEKTPFQEAQERFLSAIFIGIWVVMLVILFINSVQQEIRLRDIDYCFNEDINGELIPHVCEK